PMTGYRAIAHDLTRRIVDGEFPIGSALPSEHDLATAYDAARGTVRSALAALSTQGMVTPRQGSGWLIQSTLQNHGFTQLRSFAQWARSKGMEPGGRVISTRRARPTPPQVREFRLDTKPDVLHVMRLRSLDGR